MPTTKQKGESLEVLGTCTTNTRTDSQHTAQVEYHHLWSYAQQAALIAVSEKNSNDGSFRLINDPERRAKRIAAYYADLYFASAEKSNGKVQFRWPALAAFVVKDIVEAYRFAREEVMHHEWKDLASAARNSMAADLGSQVLTETSPYQHAIRTYAALAKGNLWLFMDIYPWLWFFLEYGINADGSLNRKRIDECLPHRDWATYQIEAKTAIEKLPYGPDWMARLRNWLDSDIVYKKAEASFAANPARTSLGGSGPNAIAALQAHLYCRTHAKDHDNGFRTPMSAYWGRFKQAFFIMEAEHQEIGRIAGDQGAISTITKLRSFTVTQAVKTTYKNLLDEFEENEKSSKIKFQKAELIAVARQEQINVLQPLIYSDPKLKETMDLNHHFSKLSNGWISPQFKVIYSYSAVNIDSELETVFDAPKDVVDRFTGRNASLPNQSDRMDFVNKIAEKFNTLMTTRRTYMETELKKIAGWVNA